MELRKDYEKLKSKYKLPDYDELDNEFELLYMRDIAEIRFPLRFIRRRIVDKIVWYCNMIQSIMQPHAGSLINLQESKFFDENTRKEMIETLKELMWHERQALYLDTNSDEKEDAKFIVDIFNKWKQVKKQLIKYAGILRDGWTKETKKEKGSQYVG